MKIALGALVAETVLVVAPLPSRATDDCEVIAYGDKQRTAVMQNLPEPLAVNVLDAGGQRVAGTIVTMEMESGSASFRYIANGTVSPDGRTALTWTDVNGTTVAVVTAGPMVGHVLVSIVASPDPELSAGIATTLVGAGLIVLGLRRRHRTS